MSRNLRGGLERIAGEPADRRGFLKQAGKLAASVPAVALLLSANATPAEAYSRYGKGSSAPRGHGNGNGHGRGHGNGNGNGNGHPGFSLRGPGSPAPGHGIGPSKGNAFGLRRG